MFRQRGALTVITPLLMLLVILLGAMALDGARLFSLRKEMQSQVNAAATAAADAAQACGGRMISLSDMRQRALAAARAQGFEGGDDELIITPGLLEDVDENGGLIFQAADFIDQTNAVLVSYQRDVKISLLLPEDIFGTVSVNVNAAVRKEAVVTMSAAGSTAVVGGGLLGALLGAILGDSDYTLDPTSLSSLANTTVQLGELLNALGVNDVAGLLPLSGQDLANALSAISGAATPLGRMLDSVASTAGIETIKVGDILSVVGESEVPPNSEFPIYDVVISLVLNIVQSQQPGEDGLLSLPLNISNLNIPLLADIQTVDLALHVGEPPTVALGPARRGQDGEWVTRFYAPDITLVLVADARLLNVDLLDVVSLNLASVKVPLAVAVGGGKGELVAADCARGRINDAEVTVDLHRQVARVATGSVNSLGDLEQEDIDTRVGTLKLLGVPLLDPAIRLRAGLDVFIPGEEKTVTFDPRYPLYCSRAQGCERRLWEDDGAGLDGLNLDVDVKEVRLLGLDLEFLLTPVTNLLEDLLNGVVSSLLKAIVNPLLQTLGIGLGGMSVTVSGVDQSNIQMVENITVAE
ncbi:MAG TPA: hypothetical protein DEB61_02700 [Alcanivorax sp.]|jgi:uncharacterized membrane protein|nr:hypothetical protein [Alcanivorax sp.]SMO43580.1 Uncharacterized membrane protein [Alcanivorax sp. DSM 26295]HBX41501.1 hypothetical protein [Marinobacter adhaerens]MBF48944.1 hypothetical protein [Alcanivorax sp.]HAI89762.1 hypothetical protein [Alcanivorax sp.]|tara:strand:+ start:14434 stop:16176 length:1743 start_codon:yes stop_codon:yes gene_type:complete